MFICCDYDDTDNIIEPQKYVIESPKLTGIEMFREYSKIVRRNTLQSINSSPAGSLYSTPTSSISPSTPTSSIESLNSITLLNTLPIKPSINAILSNNIKMNKDANIKVFMEDL